MIFLLDLNYTLVDQTWPQPKLPVRRPFSEHIDREEYRKWLVELLRPSAVILITARPEIHRKHTLRHILEKTRWSPMEAFFNDLKLRPPAFKQSVLVERIFDRWGSNPAGYFAIESNPKTRAMYARNGIQSTHVGEKPWTSLDEMIQSAV